MNTPVTLGDIQAASQRIAPYAHRTPVLTSRILDGMVNAQLYFKCESFQKTGSFKFRGACNTVFSLVDDTAKRGVATHSSGNHAAAVALAARLRGVEAHVVMPKNAPQVKKRAVAAYGATIIYCQPTLEAREKTLAQILKRTGATEVHSSNDAHVIAGQGTAALELLEETPKLDMILVPVGGGGLLSGTAIASRGVSRETEVIGTEPEGADDAARSFRSGKLLPSVNPRTIADGLLTSLGDLTFAIIRQHVHDIITVSEEKIVQAMRLVWERMKIVIEPSAAVPVAALLEESLNVAGKRAGIILSGGNVDWERLKW